jgi:hypothetical protein
MAQDVVQPMETKWLTTFLSRSEVNQQTISCIIVALEKYNNAVNTAGEKFKNDLEKCRENMLKKRKT